uniref:Nucleolar protein 16 n=1 Tax=Timema tahoe TaxID=61484 RepID=A0A7R9I9J2_9NEOP|nr:unnamed protein product [Timema tahoe]
MSDFRGMKTPERLKPKNKSKRLSDVSQTLDQHRNNLPGPHELEISTQGQNARVNSENDNLSGHYSQRHDDIVCDSHLEIETTKKHGQETNRENSMEDILQSCVSREKIKQAKYLWDLRWSRWWGYNWRRKRNEIVGRKRVIISLEKPAGIRNNPSLRDVNIFDDASIDQETGPFYDGESGCSGNDSLSHIRKTSSSRHDSKFRFKSLRRILHILSAQRTSFVNVKQMITRKNIQLLTKKFRSWVGKLSTKHDAHGDCPQPLYSLIQFPSDEVELKAVTFSKEVYSHGDEAFMSPFGSNGSRVGQCKKHPYFCSCANAPEFGRPLSPVQKDHPAASNRSPRYSPQLSCSSYDARKTHCSQKAPPFITAPVTPNSPRPPHTLNTPSLCATCSKAHRTIPKGSEFSFVKTGYSSSQLLSLSTQLNALNRKYSLIKNTLTYERNYRNVPYSSLAISMPYQYPSNDPYSKRERQEELASQYYSKKGKHPEEIEELTKEMYSKDYFTTEKPPKEIPPAKEMTKHFCTLSYSTCEPKEEEPTQSYSIAENNPKEILILEELSKEMHDTYLTKEKDSQNIITFEKLPKNMHSPTKLSEPVLLYNVVSDKAPFPPNISQQDEIVISSVMYESESSPSIDPVQWYLEDPLPDVESLLVAVPAPPFYVSPPDTARSPPTTIIPTERAMQPGKKKVTIVAPESKLANALVVLNSTAEDGEIEVRISVGAPIKKEWENSKSAVRNIEEMGLVYDPNITFKIPKTRELIKPTAEEQDDDMIEEGAHPAPKKEHVAQSIEREARAPRERTFRLPSTQVQWLSYLMDKHGDNYKAMARDGKNYYQDTWKQIRAKINRFKGIPEQYNEYLGKKKNQVSTIT